jgi:hypothetical protein
MIAKRKLREYHDTRYRRAWIVKDNGTAMHFNGLTSYVGWSEQAAGEVFFLRKDATSVRDEKRRMYRLIKQNPKNVVIQPVMVPISVGPSEHVRALRVMRAEVRKEEREYSRQGQVGRKKKQ